MELLTPLAAAGRGLGFALGLAGAATRFCTMGAISDLVLKRDDNRLRAWALAVAVALAASQGLELAGGVPLARSLYRGPNVSWLGAILGGALFGAGMVLAGGCGFRLLLRAGQGSLRAVAALLSLSLSAYATLHGVLAHARLWLERATALDLRAFGFAGQGLAELSGGTWVPALAAIVLTAALAGWALTKAAFRRDLRFWGGGLAVGLLVAGAWGLTAWAGLDGFDPQPPRSLSFVAPIGDTAAYIMTASGTSFGFTAASVLGTVLGAGALSLGTRSFHREPMIEGRDLARHLVGGGLMGVGGVLALGCTVGQGISALSTLAVTPFLVLPAIFAAAVATLKKTENSGCR